MTDLVAFLRARLDDDQHAAEAATQGRWAVSGDPLPADAPGRTPWNGSADVWVPDAVDEAGRQPVVTSHPDGGSEGCFFHGPDAVHVVRHDPSRVLADVAAKRELISEIQYFEARIDGEWGVGTGTKDVDSALRYLAVPYADHPDFDPEWGSQ